MVNEILKPEEIQDTPLPNQETTPPVNNSAPSGIQEPTKIKDVNIQTPVIANETISPSLDTLSKRILATFNFAKSGALQIGEYINGVSGDIKISPLGFLARNRRGETTVGIDGETGNAVFKGTVKAGSLISGSLILGGQDNRDGIFTLRDANARKIIIADKSGHHYYDTNGNEIVSISASGWILKDASGNTITAQVSNGMEFRKNYLTYWAGNSLAGIIQNDGALFSVFNLAGKAKFGSANNEAAIYANNAQILVGDSTHTIVGHNSGTLEANAPGGFYSNGALVVTGGGVKLAIMPTSKGYNSLYCIESPEVWFMDFVKIIRPPFWKFWQKSKIIAEDLFLEVTVPPYITMPTMNKNILQIWGKRKGTEEMRFEPKTRKEYIKNNEFWDTPKKKGNK